MRGMRGRLAQHQHLLLALLSAWLIFTSPWVHLFRRIPRDASLLDYAHIGLGLAALVIALSFTLSCWRQGGWRRLFPWLSGEFGEVARELRGLRRREIPNAESGGLFALVEGLLLVTLLATALTGGAWLLLVGSAEAVAVRHYHILAARGMMACLALHILCASLHLLDFIRE